MCLVTNDLKRRPKGISTTSTKVFHLTEIRLTLVRVRESINQSSCTLFVLPNVDWLCHQLGKEQSFPLHTQIYHFHTIPKEYTLKLKFPHLSWHRQGRTHKISRPLNHRHPKFYWFTPAHLLYIWNHWLEGHEWCSWVGWTNCKMCCNHCNYNN